MARLYLRRVVGKQEVILPPARPIRFRSSRKTDLSNFASNLPTSGLFEQRTLEENETGCAEEIKMTLEEFWN